MKSKRPNILILFTDQQRFDTIRALGASHMHTPNFDRLVRRGCAWTRAYSSCPVCMPARHDLLTGASARHHGYWVNAEKPVESHGLDTLPRALTQAGYQTIAIGKMHFFPVREHHGWAHMRLMEEIPQSREDDEYLQYLESVGLGGIAAPHGVRPLFYHSPQSSPVPEEHHGTAWVAKETIAALKQNRDCPFFIMSGWIDPHPPYSIPEKYLEQYSDASLPPPCLRPEQDERQYPFNDDLNVPDAHQLKRLREAYVASCTFVDRWIGEVLDALEETGQMENTYILFTSDHGEMLGDRQAYQKFSPYEGSAHVPLIISGPGIAPGTRSEIPASTWDVAAAVASLSGASFSADHPWAGTNLLEEKDRNKIICIHHGGDPGGFSPAMSRYVAAVGREHKFIHYYNGGDEELYDLQNDPGEQNNLLSGALSPKQAAVVEKLKQACLEFEEKHGQSERVADGRFVDDPYQKPAANISRYFVDRVSQNPRWLTYQTREECEAVIGEMMACLERDGVFLPLLNDWQDEAMNTWVRLGGQPDLMQKFFDRLEAVRSGDLREIKPVAGKKPPVRC